MRVVPNRTTERVIETRIEMPTADTTTITATEQELVERWRAQALERAGYPDDVAAELAMRSDVDLHRAIELLEKGCSPALAADILR